MGDCTRGVAMLCAGLSGRLDATGLMECELEERELVMAGLIGEEGELRPLLPGDEEDVTVAGEEPRRPRVLVLVWRCCCCCGWEDVVGVGGGETGGCWRATLLLVGAA